MDDGTAVRDDRLPCFDGQLPNAFERRVVTVSAGQTLRYDPPDWHDAIVTVDQGVIVLEAQHGARSAFTAGDLIWLDGLDLTVLRNPSERPAVLIAIRRRRGHDAD
jgi:hypothetical protein